MKMWYRDISNKSSHMLGNSRTRVLALSLHRLWWNNDLGEVSDTNVLRGFPKLYGCSRKNEKK